MNITDTRLVFVRTNTDFAVMCKTHGSRVIECALINSTFFDRDSLLLI